MLHPYRVLGLITDSKGLSTSLYRDRTLLMTTIDRQYFVYDTQNLHLVRASPILPSEIMAFKLYHDMEFVALENGELHAFHCGNKLWSIMIDDGSYVTCVHVNEVGDLVVVNSDSTVVRLTRKDGGVKNRFALGAERKYLCSDVLPNDILLLGSADGNLEVWNTASGEIADTHNVSTPEKTFAIYCVSACSYSPETVAIGSLEGQIIVYHLEEKIALLRFQHSESSAITSISFGNATTSLLTSASANGNISVWDLNEQILRGHLGGPKMHKSSVNKLRGHTYAEFLEHEPIIVTSTPDNALRLYLYDETDEHGGIIRFREGHSKECINARFIDEGRVLSTSTDRSLRLHNVKSANFSSELSQGKFGKIMRQGVLTADDLLLPQITSFDASCPRREDWSSIITTHENSKTVRTWRMDNLVLNKTKIELPEIAVQVVISRCGNLAVIGDVSGGIHTVYLQDGRIRNSLQSCVPSEVCALHISGCNTRVIVLSKCGMVAIASLFSAEIIRSFRGATSGFTPNSVLHLDSSLLCVGIRDGPIHVYSVSEGMFGQSSTAHVRLLSGHKAPLTALVLEPSTQRYLVSASLDSKIAVWDLVTEHCVASYSLTYPATSLSFDTTGSFLTTTHAGSRGVFVWTSLVKYGAMSEDILSYNESENEADINESNIIETQSFPEARELSMSKDRWHVTKQFIVEKSVTVAPLFKPKSVAAPFYLEAQYETNENADQSSTGQDGCSDSKQPDSLDTEERFQFLLFAKHYDELLKYIELKTPPEVLSEFENILSITPDILKGDADDGLKDDDDSLTSSFITEQKQLFHNALEFLRFCIRSRNNVDKIQVILALFLKTFSSTILCMKMEVLHLLEDLRTEQCQVSDCIGSLSDASVALVRNLRSR